METTLEILFVGLIVFMGVGNDPRTVIVPNLSEGENVHGNYVQAHAAVIRVKQEAVDHVDYWPSTVDPVDKDYRLYPLDGRTLSFANIDEAEKLTVLPSHACIVPHLTTECPELGKVKPMETLKAEAAANLSLAHGRLEPVCSKNGAVASRYNVMTRGQVIIEAEHENEKSRRLWLKPGRMKIEIRNEPTGTEAVKNHFIAYYKVMAAQDPGCTNLPFTRMVPPCDQCPPGEVVSTVACSNSNFP